MRSHVGGMAREEAKNSPVGRASGVCLQGLGWALALEDFGVQGQDWLR